MLSKNKASKAKASKVMPNTKPTYNPETRFAIINQVVIREVRKNNVVIA
jgi:hypothetical protein